MADQEQRVRIIRVVGGKRQELELSADRARELGIRADIRSRPTVAYLLDGVLAGYNPSGRPEACCPRCGTTHREIVLYRRTGCAQCFEMFHRTIDRLLMPGTAESAHTGRVPHRLDRYRRMFMERQELLSRLSLAVEGEDFENAATLRDRLRDLDQDLDQDQDYKLDDVEA